MIALKELYQTLALTLQAWHNCKKSGNEEWEHKHFNRIIALVKTRLPSGAGFDDGTVLDFEKSIHDRLVFHTAFHHMNESGFYDGWTSHTVTIRPSLAYGFTMRISGRDRNQIKDYIAEVFDHALRQLAD